MVWEGKIFEGFLLWLPWQPEFYTEHNYLKEFDRGPPKKHSCEVWSKSSQQFLNRNFLKEEFTDACTDKCMHGWTHNRHKVMTIACWPTASEAKNDLMMDRIYQIPSLK